MRFRRYLGEQYANKNNCYTASEQHKNGISKKTQTPLPIITIYFLGYPLKYHKVPVIKINRHYYDVVKQQRLSDKKEIFIESLTHDSYVIQISELDKQQQSELERLLSIFDQNRHITNNTHILELNENNYPQKYQRLIRRLQRAIAESTIRKTMDVEDDYLDYLEDKERMIEYQEQIIEEKNRKLKEKDQKLEKKNQLIAEQNRLIEQLKKQQ
jgi:hypothetical protein